MMILSIISETIYNNLIEKNDKPRLHPKKEKSNFAISYIKKYYLTTILIIVSAMIIYLLIVAYHNGFSCTESGMLRNYIIMGA